MIHQTIHDICAKLIEGEHYRETDGGGETYSVWLKGRNFRIRRVMGELYGLYCGFESIGLTNEEFQILDATSKDLVDRSGRRHLDFGE